MIRKPLQKWNKLDRPLEGRVVRDIKSSDPNASSASVNHYDISRYGDCEQYSWNGVVAWTMLLQPDNNIDQTLFVANVAVIEFLAVYSTRIMY